MDVEWKWNGCEVIYEIFHISPLIDRSTQNAV